MPRVPPGIFDYITLIRRRTARAFGTCPTIGEGEVWRFCLSLRERQPRSGGEGKQKIIHYLSPRPVYCRRLRARHASPLRGEDACMASGAYGAPIFGKAKYALMPPVKFTHMPSSKRSLSSETACRLRTPERQYMTVKRLKSIWCRCAYSSGKGIKRPPKEPSICSDSCRTSMS